MHIGSLKAREMILLPHHFELVVPKHSHAIFLLYAAIFLHAYPRYLKKEAVKDEEKF